MRNNLKSAERSALGLWDELAGHRHDAADCRRYCVERLSWGKGAAAEQLPQPGT
jgi:hypothetical protein